MARQIGIPGYGFINENGTREFGLPGYGFFNESGVVVSGTQIASTFVLNAPSVTYQVAGAHLASTFVLNTPSITYRIAGAHVASGLTLFASDVDAIARFHTLGAVTASSRGTQIVANGNIEGDWHELTPSAPFDVEFIAVFVWVSGTNSIESYIIDIGTASQVIGNVLHRRSLRMMVDFFWFPVRNRIRSGSQVMVRAEGPSGTSAILDVIVLLCDRLPRLVGSPIFTAHGISSGTDAKSSVTVDPGSVAHTKGDYEQLIASCPSNAKEISFILSQADNTDASFITGSWLLDLAVGTVGNEVDKISNLPLTVNSLHDVRVPRVIGPFPANLFKGQRVSVRAQSTDTGAASRLLRIAAQIKSGV